MPVGTHLAEGGGVVVELAQRTQRMLVLRELHKGDALAARRAIRAQPLLIHQNLHLLHLRLRLAGALLDLGEEVRSEAGVSVGGPSQAKSRVVTAAKP